MAGKRTPCYKKPLGIIVCIIIVVVVVVCVYFGVQYIGKSDDSLNLRSLPPNFYMGVATASYQIEGAWNEDGKGLSIWDVQTHNKSWFIKDNCTGDLASDSYHKYKEDIQMIKQTGFNMYRISVSWPRILPTGGNDNINQLGINYYHNVIDEMLANNIEPMVTLYHWDLPQALEDIGGWKNPLIADYFLNYTDIMFNEFGDKVKWWFTINEMRMIAELGYGGISYAPSLNESGTSDYLVAHNLLRAHAKAYRNYEKKYKPTQQGKIGLAYNINWYRPYDPNSAEDMAAAERMLQFTGGLYIHAIYSEEGGYPPIVRKIVDANSKAEGRTSSRLPSFTPQEIEDLKGSADFFGLNHYFTSLAKAEEVGAIPSLVHDAHAYSCNSSRDAEGFRSLLNWINDNYKIPLFFISENGKDGFDGYEDDDRVEFFHNFIGATLKAIYIDKLDIRGYIVWSIMDVFEWNNGYQCKFGLWKVDYNDTGRTRTIRKSGRYFQKLLSTGVIPEIPFTPL